MAFNDAALPFMQTARDNGFLFGGSEAPAMMQHTDEQQKSYHIQGSVFEVAPHFELLNAIGRGAYGVVCAAVDLRLVPSSAYYNEAMRTIEEEGQIVSRRYLPGSERPLYYRTHSFLGACTSRRSLRVPNLCSEPFRRRRLAGGEPSPFVAIKKVPKVFDDLVDGRRILREVKVLQHLKGHPNIIRLMEVSKPPSSTDVCAPSPPFKDIYLVTDLMDTDLGTLLQSSQEMSIDQFRYMAYQLVKALVYVHSSGVIHRDLKPGNILLNGNCDVKLCDFGLSRGGVMACPQDSSLRAVVASAGSTTEEFERWSQFGWSSAEPAKTGAAPMPRTAPVYSLTDYVVTRYYRAPELLIMSRYNHAIDMWSVGCILAEMLLRRHLFAGANYLSQLTLILETPGLRAVPRTPEELENLFDGGEEGKYFIRELLFSHNTKNRPDQGTLRNQIHAQSLFHSCIFGNNPDISVELGFLVAKLLSFDPRQRPTAIEALRDPFFRPLYDARDEIVRFSGMEAAAVQDEIKDIVAYKTSHPCVVMDELPPFTWEFDHRITSAHALQSLFEEECQASSERQKQIQSLQRCRSSTVQ